MTNTSAEALTPGEYENRIAARINAIRADHDLPKVKVNECANNCAKRWARLLAEHQHLYHQSMSIVMEKCNAEGAGEVLGTGKVTPRRMVSLWMNSPTHRRIILTKRFNRIGVGAVRDDLGLWWVVIDFTYQA